MIIDREATEVGAMQRGKNTGRTRNVAICLLSVLLIMVPARAVADGVLDDPTAEATGAVEEAASDATEPVADVTGTASDAAAEATQSAGNAAESAGNAAESATQGAATIAQTAGNAAQTPRNVAGQVTQTAGNAAGQVTQTAGNAAGQVTQTAGNVVEEATQTAESTIGGVTQTAGSVTQTAGSAVNEVAETTVEVTSTAGTVVVATTQTAGGTADGVTQAAGITASDQMSTSLSIEQDAQPVQGEPMAATGTQPREDGTLVTAAESAPLPHMWQLGSAQSQQATETSDGGVLDILFADESEPGTGGPSDPCDGNEQPVCLGLLYGLGDFVDAGVRVLGTLALTGISAISLLLLALGLASAGSGALASARRQTALEGAIE